MAARGVVAVWLMSSAGAASLAGGAPPDIDASGYCRQVVEISKVGGSAVEAVYDGCMRAEATARSRIIRVWSDIRDVDQSACLIATPAASPSNQELADCLAAAVATRFLDGDLHFCAGALHAALEAP